MELLNNKADETMISPAIILIEPQMGENIGAAARCMLNFDLTDLRIVNPRDGWPNPKAVDMSKGAKDVIRNAKIFDKLSDALHDIEHLYATTARSRDMIKPVFTPHKTASEITSYAKQGRKSAIMFGPERTGLSNEDIVFADAITYIPVGETYSSINLAQAVALLSYEYFMANYDGHNNTTMDLGKSAVATKQEIAGFFSHLEEELDKKGFFLKVPDKRARMIDNIRNIFTRVSNLTDQEVRTLRGIIKSLAGNK